MMLIDVLSISGEERGYWRHSADAASSYESRHCLDDAEIVSIASL